jgi:hypothetical protein
LAVSLRNVVIAQRAPGPLIYSRTSSPTAIVRSIQSLSAKPRRSGSVETAMFGRNRAPRSARPGTAAERSCPTSEGLRAGDLSARRVDHCQRPMPDKSALGDLGGQRLAIIDLTAQRQSPRD